MADVTSRTFDELVTRELHDILRLRRNVFVVEQACVYPDVDGRDIEPVTSHHWIERDGTVAAYLRVLRDIDRTPRIGRVLTAPTHAGMGSRQPSCEPTRQGSTARSCSMPRPIWPGGTSGSVSRSTATSSSRTAFPTCRCDARADVAEFVEGDPRIIDGAGLRG